MVSAAMAAEVEGEDLLLGVGEGGLDAERLGGDAVVAVTAGSDGGGGAAIPKIAPSRGPRNRSTFFATPIFNPVNQIYQ
jgi:hypothetical protein